MEDVREEVRELKELLEIKVKSDFLVEVILKSLTPYSNGNGAYIDSSRQIITALKVVCPEKLEKRLKELEVTEDKEV